MMNNSNMLCPCGSQLLYPVCCGPFLADQAIPKTPEALMRSRYTAYSLADIDYIQKTMRGKSLVGFDAEEAKRWALSVQWLGLKVIFASQITEESNIGFVEFKASFMQLKKRKVLQERSEFHRIDGRWYYISGVSHKRS